MSDRIASASPEETGPLTKKSPDNFADRLIERVRALGHPLCVGFDPHLERIPALFRRGDMRLRSPGTADAVEGFVMAVLERLPGRVAAVKPQSAFFEQLGWRGVRVLERLIAAARKRGLLVILDAKRGDIGSTAEGYARAHLDSGTLASADALTLNPYLGLDTLVPFVKCGEESGNGFFVLVKTSNPGSGDLQDRLLEGAGAGGEPVYLAVAGSLEKVASRLLGTRTGWSSLGVVVGATYPEPALLIRERLPNSLFLVPGYGAQGASATAAVRGFVPGPSGLEGGIVASSRAILFPRDAETDTLSTWEKAIDAAVDQAANELGEAVTRSAD